MAIINREAAEALIQEQLQSGIMQDTPKTSTFLQMARKLPNMTSNQTRMMVLDALPMVYWVNGDTGHKQTTEQAWDNVYLYPEELAAIVPIPEAVLDDASFDILGEVQPRIVEAMGVKIDNAALFGIERPRQWPLDILSRARQAGNNVPVSSGADYYDLIMGQNGLIAKVEESGYMVSGAVSAMGMRAKLRGLRDSNGQPIFKTDMQGSTQYALDGAPMFFPRNGAFDGSLAQMIAGDFSQAVYSIRQDVTVKILDQATIVEPTTKQVVYSLAQQDMIALRVVMRLGIAFPNYATRLDPDRTRFPFAYLEPETPFTAQTVTFTVEDNAETPAPIDGAVVELEGSRAKSNSSGQAVFHLRSGSYRYQVKKRGFHPVSGTVQVEAAGVSVPVTLLPNA